MTFVLTYLNYYYRNNYTATLRSPLLRPKLSLATKMTVNIMLFTYRHKKRGASTATRSTC